MLLRGQEKQENAVLLRTSNSGSEWSLIGADLCCSIPKMKGWALSCHTLLSGEDVVISSISRLPSFASRYQWLDENFSFFFHFPVSVSKSLQSLPSALRNLEQVAVTSSRNLWGHTSQHKQFGTWWCYVNTSAHKTDVVITLSFQHFAEKPQWSRCRVPECQLMTGQLGKSSKFVTEWQRAVMDWRAAEHPQHSWLPDTLSGLTASTADAQLINTCTIGNMSVHVSGKEKLVWREETERKVWGWTIFFSFALDERTTPSSNWWTLRTISAPSPWF